MSQAAVRQPSRKKAVISLLVLLALTCIIVFTFKDHWAEITAALAQLSVWQVLAVLAVGLSYPLLEGCVAWVIVRSRLPQFKLWQGLDVGWCGTFGNVVTLGAGAVPVQLYYLHKAGLPLGPGAGLMTLEYVFHKSTVLLYATVMLLLQHRWLSVNTTGVMRYLPMAYAVVAVIIVALVLLCVSPLVQNLARWLLGFLPKTEKWQQRRADWLEQLKGWMQSGQWLEREHPDGRAARLDTVLVGLDYHIGLLYKLIAEEVYFQIFLNPDGTEQEELFWSSEENGEPELYTEEEMSAIEEHIKNTFGEFENVFHELVSPDIHVDICIVPPTEERDYYTLVTMGMGAHRMNVPEELAEYKLERAELAIALPADWKLDQESMKDEKWYWPIRLLKSLARLPIASDTWLGFGHTMDNKENFAENTKLCAAILTGPQSTEEGGEVCTLPGGEEVNFYQVIPLYEDELDYKLEHDVDALLDKMAGISFVVNPTRQDAITRGTLSNDDFDGEMDDASYHIESIEEKELPIDPINAYNHMAIYLRWCMEHDLMGEDFLKEYSEVAKQVKDDSASVDLREFIRDELDGCLFSVLFNQQGRAFAGYYYGEGDSPYYPADVDDNALRFFGPGRYHSDEFQDEAYLFIPFDEDYYQAMAEVIEERFENWQGQDFDEDTLEPSEVAHAIMEYLDCECTYFPSMADDDPIMSAYSYAQRLGVREGFVPVLIQADDETLLECLVMNADPEHDADFYEFDLKTVTEYRKKMLSAPVKDGKAVLEELTGQRKEEAEDDDLDWEEEVLGEMEGGEPNDRFANYWNDDTGMTYPLILAKIPVKNPWEIFAYLPFGNWNECPDTPDLMAVAKYWFEQHGAIPAAMSHDELEFELPTPISKERAMEVAVEQYGFCPDLDQNEDGSIGSLADVLWQSTVWYFWWD